MQQVMALSDVVSRVAREMQCHIQKYEELAQGRSGAWKMICRAEGGKTYFVKFVSPEASFARQWSLMTREATVLQQLPANSALPRLIVVVNELDLIAVVTEYVGDSHVQVWDPNRAHAAFLTTTKLYRELAGVTVSARRIESKPTRFRAFSVPDNWTRIEHMSSTNKTWIESHRGELAQIEERARQLVRSDSVIHCDLAVDNFVFNADGNGCYLVDWSHAHLGQPAYDIACMLVRVRADSAWSPELGRSLQDLNYLAEVPWNDMLVLAAANFIQRSEGEADNPLPELSHERLRYANAAIDWLREVL